MKCLLFVMLLSLNVFANEEVSVSDPTVKDINIVSLTQFYCNRSGYFNVDVCEKDVNKCFTKTDWPKTITLVEKINVFQNCVAKYIR